MDHRIFFISNHIPCQRHMNYEAEIYPICQITCDAIIRENHLIRQTQSNDIDINATISVNFLSSVTHSHFDYFLFLFFIIIIPSSRVKDHLKGCADKALNDF